MDLLIFGRLQQNLINNFEKLFLRKLSYIFSKDFLFFNHAFVAFISSLYKDSLLIKYNSKNIASMFLHLR